jgi:hypothetical protein
MLKNTKNKSSSSRSVLAMSTYNMIHLQQMIQLAEAVDAEDDWTGVTSAIERRKRQNRLNSRAHRTLHFLLPLPSERLLTSLPTGRRKALELAQHQSQPGSASISDKTTSEPLIPHWSESHQRVVLLPGQAQASKAVLPFTTTPTTLDRVTFPLCPENLLTLLQYNVLRACFLNRSFISRLHQQDQEAASTALVVLPDLPLEVLSTLLPESLHPTLLQRSVPHASWIDILPHPRLRDNLIRSTTIAPPVDATGEFSEDALWTDTVGGLFEGFSISGSEHHTGGIVWDTPWNVSGWELSEGFWRKYRMMFRGLEAEALEATNRWRRIRGEIEL